MTSTGLCVPHINCCLVFLLLTLVNGSVESIWEVPRNGSCDCPPIIFDPENEETLWFESLRIQGQKGEGC